jgi:hypothetical protein
MTTKRAIIRLRFANELGEGFTDIGVDEVTARALVDAGCDCWESTAPFQRGADTLYVEVFNLPYVQELGRQRDEYRKEAGQAVELAANLERELNASLAKLKSKEAALAATRGDLAKEQWGKTR